MVVYLCSCPTMDLCDYIWWFFQQSLNMIQRLNLLGTKCLKFFYNINSTTLYLEQEFHECIWSNFIMLHYIVNIKSVSCINNPMLVPLYQTSDWYSNLFPNWMMLMQLSDHKFDMEIHYHLYTKPFNDILEEMTRAKKEATIIDNFVFLSSQDDNYFGNSSHHQNHNNKMEATDVMGITVYPSI